jgi:hypothetical protein
VYVVAATGGSPTYWPYGQHPAHCVTLIGQLGSCMVDVNDRRLDFRFIGADTNVLDHFTIIKETTPPDLKITAVSYARNQISLTWDSIPGRVYQVYRQRTLNDAPVLVADQIQASGESTSWSGDLGSADKMGFFLVAVLPN